jgi:hypothetical protein
MNLHIQKLAEQAGMNIVDDKFSTYGKFAEKFAELIVQECAEWIKNTDSNEEVGEENAAALLNHFGVEE